ncbi:MAG: hypothetical protein AAFQ80_21430 [Cyanobacteria bacterium J06621_8]
MSNKKKRYAANDLSMESVKFQRQELEALISKFNREVKPQIVEDKQLIKINFNNIENLISKFELFLKKDFSNAEIYVKDFTSTYNDGINSVLSEFNQLNRKSIESRNFWEKEYSLYSEYFGNLMDRFYPKTFSEQELYDYIVNCFNFACQARRECWEIHQEQSDILAPNRERIIHASSFLNKLVKTLRG